MINQNNINKYGVECYKTAYQLIQKLRGQELMIIKELRAVTRLNLSDVKTVIEDVKSNENAYYEYLYSNDKTETGYSADIASSADELI